MLMIRSLLRISYKRLYYVHSALKVTSPQHPQHFAPVLLASLVHDLVDVETQAAEDVR